MSEWRTLTLGDICKDAGGGIQTGPFGSQLHASDYVADGTPSVMPQNIGDNRIVSDGIARVADSDVRRLRKHWLEPGDIVYSRRGDVERRALVRGENAGWLCGTGCLRVRISDQSVHDSRFVSYVLGLEESRYWIARHAVGATMLNLNTAILSAVPLKVPDVLNQRAIADVLGAFDDKIAANDRAALTALRLMIAHAGTAERRIDVASLARHSTRAQRPEQFEEVVAHYSLPAFDATSGPATTARAEIKSNKFVLDEPVVLVSKLNPRIPRVWNVLRIPAGMAVASTEFVVLVPSAVSTSTLWAALSQPSVSVELANKVSGTSGSHQRVKPVEILELIVPDPRSLPDDVRNEVDALGDVVHSLQTECQRLAATRDELLPLLMSGKVRVRDAERQVEDAL